jgi:2-polyprenyl-6-hydroxyphenyl methylase/3-demethylubiquinone-9 3-methyltransferase
MSTKSSINAIELEKFSKISSQWWQEGGEFKMLHQINPLRLSYIMDKMKNHFNPNNKMAINILDVGCGGGLVTSGICKLNTMPTNEYNITGIDAIQDNIDVAIKHAEEQNLNIKYSKSTIEELVLSDNKQYDVVLCLEVLEHIDNLDDFVKNLANITKPNGIIIISTINRTIKSYMLAILMAEYVLGWVPQKTHDYSKFLQPSEIYSRFSKNNVLLKELKGLTYNIITRTWQLSRDIDVNYFAYLTKKI